MYLTVETTDGGIATVNLASVTHITQLENAYAEAGSVIHFVSDRSLQVKLPIEELIGQLGKKSVPGAGREGGSLMFRSDEPGLSPA